MCARMLPPPQRSEGPHRHRLTTPLPVSGGQRDQRSPWSWGLAIVNLVIAAEVALLWRGSYLMLGLGVLLVIELVLLALFYLLARHGRG